MQVDHMENMTQRIDYADQDLGALGSSLLNLAGTLIDAKNAGQTLPPFVDKIATAAINAKQGVVDLGIATAKDQAKKNIPWIIAGVLSVIVVVILIMKK